MNFSLILIQGKFISTIVQTFAIQTGSVSANVDEYQCLEDQICSFFFLQQQIAYFSHQCYGIPCYIDKVGIDKIVVTHFMFIPWHQNGPIGSSSTFADHKVLYNCLSLVQMILESNDMP